MQPKRRPFLLLLLLLSFAAILLLPLHSPLSHPSLRLLNHPLPLHSTPSPRNFTFLIKLLAFDRPDSLRRCLRSLAAADYGADRVSLHVSLDHAPLTEPALADRKLEDTRRILDLVDAFPWPHGDKLLHYRTSNAGLQAQWLEAWWPSSDQEFAFIVEDDLEVSPLYYKFLKQIILHYYYDPSNYSPSIFGASLQRPRFVAGKHGNKLQLDSSTHLFLYQLVGTWGQLLFPRPWKEFRLWYDLHKAKGMKPLLQGMVTTGWYKSKGERIWTPWFIKFVHSRGYFNIYTNFLQESALSISHRDAGVNYRRTIGPDSSLLDESSLVGFNLWELQPLRNLKWYDFCFREVIPGRIVGNLLQLGTVLKYMLKKKIVTLISLYGTEKTIARNLLCHLERVGMQDYILMSDGSEFLNELARRGYPVIDASQLTSSISSYNSAGFDNSAKESLEIFVKANVIKACLELGYSVWLVEGNMVPLSATVPAPSHESFDFFVAKDIEMLLVRNTPSSVKLWDDRFISAVVAESKTLQDVNSVSSKDKGFMYILDKTLEAKGKTRLWRSNEWTEAVLLGVYNANHTVLKGETNMVYWPSRMEPALVERQLESRDLWLVDEDSSCRAVVCKPQQR